MSGREPGASQSVRGIASASNGEARLAASGCSSRVRWRRAMGEESRRIGIVCGCGEVGALAEQALMGMPPQESSMVERDNRHAKNGATA
jgi:hypothetical protein